MSACPLSRFEIRYLIKKIFCHDLNFNRTEEALAKPKDNQERPLARKLAKENGMTYNSKKSSLAKTEVPFSSFTESTSQIKPEQKYGHCGQIGHVKTNWKCLRWAEFNPRSAGVFASASTLLFGSMQSNFPGGGGNNEYGGSVAGTPVGKMFFTCFQPF
ncbi:hypothetical protein BY996DRAFT_6413602 [Phakopsora pachyrhizi]|nr:hypothetical protein BY996DRAFT_6413602 [Phakopsora pachyrhizi]